MKLSTIAAWNAFACGANLVSCVDDILYSHVNGWTLSFSFFGVLCGAMWFVLHGMQRTSDSW
jgi:hypothetical protein